MKYFLVGIALILTLCVPAQSFPLEYRIDSNLLVYLPVVPDHSVEKGVDIYYSNSEGMSYQVIVNRANRVPVKNKFQLKAALAGLTYSFKKDESKEKIKQKIVDTTIGGMEGKYIKELDPSSDAYETHIFATIQEGCIYAVQAVVTEKDNPKSDYLIQQYFKNIKFSGKPYKQTDTIFTGFKLNSLAGKIILFLFLSGFLVFIYKISSRPAKNKRSDSQLKPEDTPK